MAALWRLVRRVAHAAHDAFEPVGMSIFQDSSTPGGQGIPHYQVYVVPRYSGEDPNALFGPAQLLLERSERVRITKLIASNMPS